MLKLKFSDLRNLEKLTYVVIGLKNMGIYSRIAEGHVKTRSEDLVNCNVLGTGFFEVGYD